MPKKGKIWSQKKWKKLLKDNRASIDFHFRQQYSLQAAEKIDLQLYINKFSQETKKIQKSLVNKSLSSLAAINAGEHATEVLYDLGFTESRVESAELRRLSLIIFRIEIFSVLLQNSDLPKKIKKQIHERFVAQLIPLRDGSVPAAKQANLMQQMQEMISKYEAQIPGQKT